MKTGGLGQLKKKKTTIHSTTENIGSLHHMIHWPLGYIQPLQQYLDKWKTDSTFYQDFIYSCPFDNEVTKHLITKLETLSTHKTWGYLFDYFSTTYTADELADLVYEALCYLNEGEFYLKFLINHHYTYMWPKGNNFCDPYLPIPSTLLY